ncbi:hypothetical protein G7054_g9740 [Neopestalotiopsis clavispora]|nr:hypothetical protein G7054_g9740 [Neopestalotiopsis clavispora]
MADKLRIQHELERLQAKYIGTGHPDTSSWEWRTNISRDTYSSIVGHPPMLAYHALAQGEPSAKGSNVETEDACKDRPAWFSVSCVGSDFNKQGLEIKDGTDIIIIKLAQSS